MLINSVEPVSNLPQIFYVSFSDAAERRITNDLNAYFGISASDDGKTIVTAQRLFAKNISVFSGDNPNQANKISKESNIHSTAVFTPDGRIIYDAADNNRPHIWMMNADGSNPQQLTPNDSTDFQPLASPDGRFIFFISERTGDRKIWRMDIDGSNQQNLTPFEGIMFSHNLNPEKQTVFFDWNKNEKKVMGEVPLAGGEIREFSLFGNSLTAYSPDAEQVAYVFIDEKDKKRKVRVRPFESEEPVTVFDISPIEFLRWTADGKGLLYREIETDDESVSTVWLQTVSGGKPQPFLSVKPDMVFNVSQSKGGKQSAVVRGNLLTDAVMLSKIEPN